jgi:sugar-specific transcriptional regulator TrmB
MKDETEAIVARVAAIGIEGVAARVNAASLELGESSTSDIARLADVPRTSAAYALDELVGKGVMSEVVRGRARLFRAVPLAVVFEEVRDSLRSAEAVRVPASEKATSPFRAPEAQILKGPAGFREAWRRVLSSGAKSFTLISDQKEFADYMREHDILEDIIAEKVRRGIASRNIVVDTDDARRIALRDPRENRQTRFLPRGIPVPMVEVACEELAFFAMPRQDGTVVIVDYPEFGQSRLAAFDAIWATLGK